MLLNDLNVAKYEETYETLFKGKVGSGTKCLINQLCDVIKMWQMRGEVRKKTKKEMDNSLFL